MKRLLPLIVLFAVGCDREPQASSGTSKLVVTEANDTRRSQPPSVIPMPSDQVELDRMILAGYTPHADHMHPPGIKNCPLAKEGNEAVM